MHGVDETRAQVGLGGRPGTPVKASKSLYGVIEVTSSQSGGTGETRSGVKVSRQAIPRMGSGGEQVPTHNARILRTREI